MADGDPGGLITPEGYDAVYRRRARLALIAALDRRSLGWPKGWNTGTYAADGEREELAACLKKTARRGNAVIVDLGCGEGSMGRHVAAVLRRPVLGIDFSPVALALAMKRRQPRQIFALADLRRLPLADAVAGAAFSWDALYLVADRAQALRETARVLGAGAPLVFTAYFPDSGLAKGRRAWTALLRRSGFELEDWSERTAAWRAHMRERHARRLAHAARLLEAYGEAAMPDLSVSRAMLGVGGRAPFLSQVSRIWARAVRR